MKHSFPFQVLAFAALLVADCQKHDSAADPDVDYYTCTMHPSVHSHDPKAKCPICSMDLVPVMKKGATGVKTPAMAAASPNEFSVPVERQQQIGVTYAKVEKKPLRHTIRSVGFVTPDKSRRWGFVARVEGYVQTLHVTSPGQPVEKDQPLLSIYSPDLLTAERELVNLIEARGRAATAEGRSSTDRLIETSRRRLEQWNITPQQIAALEKSREPSQVLTLHSPFRGVVEEVPVDQGRKVMAGDPLVNIADLSLVWVWAEFYEDEISMIKPGLRVRLTTSAYPGEKFEGTISLVNPFVNATLRTVKARVDIPNEDFRLRPGMFVNLETEVDMGEGLAIPLGAVLPTGAQSLVFVDKGQGKLESRSVQLGRKFGEFYQVLGGLKEGEAVVASANFLIDAESKVQGAAQSFSGPEAGDSMKQVAAPPAVPLPQSATSLFQPVIESYFALERTLAQDELDASAAAAAQLRERMDAITRSDVRPSSDAGRYHQCTNNLAKTLSDFHSGSLEEARVHFGRVSAALIALLSEFPPPLGKSVYVMNCSMWEKSPHEWVQFTLDIENPFMGKKMSGCGDLVRTLQAK
ncbi:MAG TPA: efflux RND transporter periplasmic adaptor subunit [Verrucomicrobiaceae bacterium]|jgi:RND family efflux transporter MFP subunit